MNPPDRGALKRPLAYLKDHKPASAVALMSVFAVLGGNLITPLLTRSAIDDGIAHHDAHALAVAIGGLALLAVSRGVFGFLSTYMAERVSQHVAYSLRDDLFTKIQRLSFAYYDQSEAGALLTRVTNDVDQVRSFVGSGLTVLAQSIVMLVLTIGAMLMLDWRLALLSLLTVTPIGVVMARFTKQIRPIFMAVQMHTTRMNTILRETLAGVRIVRTFGRQAHEAGRYGGVNDALRGKSIEATRAGSNTFPVIMLSANLGTLVIIGFGGWRVMHGELTLGTLLAFTTYLGLLLQPIMSLGFASMMIARASVSAGRIAEIFDAPLDVTDKPDAKPLGQLQGAIAFDHVSFRYPGGEADVLKDVTFEVEPGETVAIVGMTGSGKSSLAHLLPRFYDVTAGRVLIDGQDVRDVQLASLRSQLGIVLQEPLLFGGTIADNIAYGKPDASREEVVAAARAAQAAAFIDDLPDGYETVIGERGVGLSGGQRQRIAIARALLVDPRLIILDDSTSAVDAGTEAAIQASLDELMRSGTRTCVVIAHRFSTVRDADRILVLDGGKLVAQGTHQALMASSPVYQDILGTQFQAGGTPA